MSPSVLLIKVLASSRAYLMGEKTHMTAASIRIVKYVGSVIAIYTISPSYPPPLPGNDSIIAKQWSRIIDFIASLYFQ